MREKLEIFLADLPIDKISKQLERNYSIDKEYSLEIIETFSNEARVTFNLIEGYLAKDKRLLEVGAGLCIFSLFLKKEGFNITALEPALAGFGFFEHVKKEVLIQYSELDLDVLSIPADQLDQINHGHFDIIFSNNVIEHILNLDESFLSMAKVLAEGGVMLHTCPNYLFPYEPHFGIPVVKPFSKLFKKVFKIRSDVWESLNFITYFDVKRIANANNLNVFFEKRTLYNSLLRMEGDALFCSRHSGGLIYKIFQFLKCTYLLKVIKYFPVMFSTPMLFRMTHKQ